MKKSWGKAKIEVLALRSDILDLLNQGFSKHEIYRRYKSEQKLTLGFRTFSRHAKKIYEDATLSGASTRTTAATATIPSFQKRTAPTPVVHKVDDGESLSTGSTFSYDPSATDEDLW